MYVTKCELVIKVNLVFTHIHIIFYTNYVILKLMNAFQLT